MFGQEPWPLKNGLSPQPCPTVCLSEVCEWKKVCVRGEELGGGGHVGDVESLRGFHSSD